MDETSARRGHRYVTTVLDAETHELLLIVEGRSAAALEAFAQALVAHGGKVEQIELWQGTRRTDSWNPEHPACHVPR